jgi:dienelactone hydrolase
MNISPFSPIFRLGILLGLSLVVAAPIRLTAQDTGTTDAAKPPSTLAELMQHRNLWPTQLTLKAPVQLDIVSNGKKVGSTVSPEGSTVDLVSVSETALQIKVVSATASVSPDQTDLWTQVAALYQKSGAVAASPSPAPAPGASPVAPPTSPPAPPDLRRPTAPTPAQPPTPGPAKSPASPQAQLADTVAPTTGDPLQFDYEVRPRDNFQKAAFRFWSPSYKDPIRGIILLTSYGDGDGRTMAGDDSWQALAEKYRLALVGCFFKATNGADYCDAPHGSGAALFEALSDFAKESNRPEVAQAALILYGEGEGGQFNYNFVLWKPERVVCFVVNKGGVYSSNVAGDDTRAVPGLFIFGTGDDKSRATAITKIWKEGRDHGALWTLAPQANSGRDFSQTAAFAHAFFEPMLKSRLPDVKVASDSPPQLNAMEENKGWLGDLTTHEIHAESADKEPNLSAAWLPDQSFAQAWKDFVSP